MRIVVVLMTVVVASCGSDGPTSPTRTLSQTETTTHYVFHRTEADRIDSSRQEAFHEWVVTQLGFTPNRAIHYYKYLDRSHMNEITGRETNGFAEPFALTLHSIWPFDAMNQFFPSSSGRNESDAQVRQRTVSVWGKSVETLQAEWLAFLQN